MIGKQVFATEVAPQRSDEADTPDADERRPSHGRTSFDKTPSLEREAYRPSIDMH